MASGLSKWHATTIISLVALQWQGLNESVKNCSWSSCPWQFDQLNPTDTFYVGQNMTKPCLSGPIKHLVDLKKGELTTKHKEPWLTTILVASASRPRNCLPATLGVCVCHLHTKLLNFTSSRDFVIFREYWISRSRCNIWCSVRAQGWHQKTSASWFAWVCTGSAFHKWNWSN